MSKSVEENIDGAITDEFSLQDTLKMLVREHNMSDAEAINYLRERFERNAFSLYRDRDDSKECLFEKMHIDDISDFQNKEARFVFLTRFKY